MIETVALDVTPVRGPFSFYLNWRETSILIALAGSVAPKVFIEFGCNLGITAKRVLENIPSIETYVGIDVRPDHVTPLACQHNEVPAHPGSFANDPRFHLLIADHELARKDLEAADAVFIDGDHSFEAVAHDSELARELVRPNGVIVWHDWNNISVEVTPVLERLHEEGWPIKGVEHSWLAFMKT